MTAIGNLSRHIKILVDRHRHPDHQRIRRSACFVRPEDPTPYVGPFHLTAL